jgi:extracellular factor (EF) 3-hydroxypalmitic acid methyl ester biosynthesis protein
MFDKLLFYENAFSPSSYPAHNTVLTIIYSTLWGKKPMDFDRRKIVRNASIQNSFILVQNPMGSPKVFNFKICDYHEKGLSFLIAGQTGYFLPGTPLYFTLSNEPSNEQFGIIRYCHQVIGADETNGYKAGLEIVSGPKDIHHGDLKLRPHRISGNNKDTDFVTIYTNNTYQTFQLIDVSSYSVCFASNSKNYFDFKVSQMINQMTVVLRGKNIFSGNGIVTKVYVDNKDRWRVVVQPKKELFKLKIADIHEKIDTAVLTAKNCIDEQCKIYSTVDIGFKTIVTDLKIFLELNKMYLDDQISLNTSAEETEFLEGYNDYFFSELEKHVLKLESMVPSLKLSDEKYLLYKKYFQDQIHSLLLKAPFCLRMYSKPLGYAGDFEMMRMIRENIFSGPSLYFKLVNKHVLQNNMSQSNRNRNQYLCKKLNQIIKNIGENKLVNILSVASGPAHEIIDLISSTPELSGRINLTLLDQEILALSYSQEKIYEQCIKSDFTLKVNFIHKSIQNFIKDIIKNQGKHGSFDIIYCFGLFDYFDDKSATKILNYFSKFLKDSGGSILISNYSLDGHFHRTYLEMAFEWFMIYRNRNALQKLASQVTKAKAFTIDEEPLGVIKFLEIEC